jgi:adenylate kinase family enzyme
LKIALIGKTGSGKTTLAKYLSDVFNLEHINPRQVCQDYAKTHKEFADEINYLLANGLQPSMENGLEKKIWDWKLKTVKDNYILDNLSNTNKLKIFEAKQKFDFIFHLAIDDATSKKRIEQKPDKQNVDLKTHFENRSQAFKKYFPVLKNALGARIIDIDALQSAEQVRRLCLDNITKL